MPPTGPTGELLPKGRAEMLLLALIEARPRHGYELAKLIEARSEGKLQYHVASLYPMLYKLEKRGWVQGKWVEKAGERRRRFYSLTAAGKRELAAQRQSWRDLVRAVARIAEEEKGLA